ncbi:MAG: DUF4368 domain-containing protein [Faecousia sp.]
MDKDSELPWLSYQHFGNLVGNLTDRIVEEQNWQPMIDEIWNNRQVADYTGKNINKRDFMRSWDHSRTAEHISLEDVLENGVNIDGEQLYDIADPRGEFESTVLTEQSMEQFKGKLECPAYYLAVRGCGSHKNNVDMTRPYDWNGNTVGIILAKPEYLGHTVNFRTSQKSYKDKRVKNAPEDWLIFENTHEDIIDKATWDWVQEIRQTVRRTDTTGEANPLTGLMFCADCGAKMYNHRNRNAQFLNDNYNCSAYTRTATRETRLCCSHSISTRTVCTLLLETIRTVSAYAISNEEAFRQKVLAASKLKHEADTKELKKKIAKAKKRSAELDVLIKKLYESYAMGKISEHRFDALCAEYEREQAEMEAMIATEQSALEAFRADTDRADQFLALAKKYTDFTELTTPMIFEFVDKILVHAPEKIDGERTMEIDIYLKFIGKFDIPMPEPTPEELAELEAQRKKRAANRAKYYRKKERQKLLAQLDTGAAAPPEEQTA